MTVSRSSVLDDDNFHVDIVETGSFPAPQNTLVLGAGKDRVFLNASMERPAVAGEYALFVNGGVGIGTKYLSTRQTLANPEPLQTIQIDANDSAGSADGEIWWEAGGTQRNDVTLIAVERHCGCPEYGKMCCDMAKPYSYNQSSLSLAGSSTLDGMLFGANPRRVTLTLTCGDTTANAQIYITRLNGPAGIFLRLSCPFTFIMPYRDFGPLVREPVYVISSGTAPGATIEATEVFQVP